MVEDGYSTLVLYQDNKMGNQCSSLRSNWVSRVHDGGGGEGDEEINRG